MAEQIQLFFWFMSMILWFWIIILQWIYDCVHDNSFPNHNIIWIYRFLSVSFCDWRMLIPSDWLGLITITMRSSYQILLSSCCIIWLLYSITVEIMRVIYCKLIHFVEHRNLRDNTVVDWILCTEFVLQIVMFRAIEECDLWTMSLQLMLCYSNFCCSWIRSKSSSDGGRWSWWKRSAEFISVHLCKQGQYSVTDESLWVSACSVCSLHFQVNSSEST